MTRRDYALITTIIKQEVSDMKELRKQAHYTEDTWHASLVLLERMAYTFAGQLSAMNKSFDRKRFIEDCGL